MTFGKLCWLFGVLKKNKKRNDLWFFKEGSFWKVTGSLRWARNKWPAFPIKKIGVETPSFRHNHVRSSSIMIHKWWGKANFKREAYYLEVSSEEWAYHQFFHFSLHDVGYVQKDSNLLIRRFIKKMLEDTGDDTLLLFVQKRIVSMHFQNNTTTRAQNLKHIQHNKHEQTSSYSSNHIFQFSGDSRHEKSYFSHSNAVCKSSSLCQLLASAGIKLHHFPK